MKVNKIEIPKIFRYTLQGNWSHIGTLPFGTFESMILLIFLLFPWWDMLVLVGGYPKNRSFADIFRKTWNPEKLGELHLEKLGIVWLWRMIFGQVISDGSHHTVVLDGRLATPSENSYWKSWKNPPWHQDSMYVYFLRVKKWWCFPAKSCYCSNLDVKKTGGVNQTWNLTVLPWQVCLTIRRWWLKSGLHQWRLVVEVP